MTSRPLVIIESPFAGEISRNVTYARRAVAHAIHLGEAPIASHLLYTQPGVLLDHLSHERQLGITCGLAWSRACDYHAFYLDLGWSRGMRDALHFCMTTNTKHIFRTIGEFDVKTKVPLSGRILRAGTDGSSPKGLT